MSTTVQAGAAIAIGWPYAINITSPSAIFPAGAVFKADFKRARTDPTPLFELTTANNGLVRVSDTSLTVAVTAAQSALLTAGSVLVDIARTDVPNYLGFVLTIPVLQPVTRP